MKKSNQVYLSPHHSYPISVDFYWLEASSPKPLILFLHGFKGFKDWGHWSAIAALFAEKGYCFAAVNFSHNGTSLEQPLNFVDLEAFGHNNYSKELGDVQTVLQNLIQEEKPLDLPALALNDITIIGHSRGGPIALITALEQHTIQRVVTWSSVHRLDYRWVDQKVPIQEWKEKGVMYIHNSRTQQEMPLYYQLYEDFQANEERLSVTQTLQQLNKPYLIVHGTADTAVSCTAADFLEQQGLKTQKVLIEAANHVFGGKHPFQDKKLPIHSQQLVQETLNFIQQTN